MVIEHYTAGPRAVYERAAAQGRMLPEGLRYIDSWIVDDDRLDPDWRPHVLEQNQAILDALGLTGDFWRLA